MTGRYFVFFPFLLIFSACQSKTVNVTPSKPTNTACANTYTKFYDQDQLDFRIVFGYKDARPARFVGDEIERAYLVQKLTDYGFKRSEKNREQFFYQLTGMDGRQKTIQLSLVASTVGPDDDENRKNPFQKWSSAHAKEVFIQGLAGADLVFYYGHSRDGGGPDFSVPKLTADSHTDYTWYKKAKPGVREMLRALKVAPRGPKVLGLYSCVSDKLFTHALHEMKPNMGLMVSHSLLYYVDALNGMFETLVALLEMRCKGDFHAAGTEAIYFF